MKTGSFLLLIPTLALLISLIKMRISTAGKAAIKLLLSIPFQMLVGKDRNTNRLELILVMPLNQLKEGKLCNIATQIKCSLLVRS
jgi:hypothetical protein